jgi:hypothetical protein
MEEFRIIKDYENYSISNFGNVKNNKTERILKPVSDSHGYYRIRLSTDGKGNLKAVHRLVAQTFLENPENKRCVDHINNIRTDNRVENLRFATHRENNMNSSKPKNNTSGNKGVHWHKRDKVWYAKIQINGKKLHLGNFETKEEAVKKRVETAKKLFGEFINTCEQIKEDITELKNEKQKELDEIEELERELNEILKTK